MRAYRVGRGRVLAGVATGLAEHLGWSVALTRFLFVAMAFAGGFGVLLYAAYWAVLPLRPEDPVVGPGGAARGAPGAPDNDLGRLLALAAVALGVLGLAAAAGYDVLGSLLLPVVAAGLGAALLWRQADDAERDRWRRGAAGAARTAGDGPRAGWRVVAGAALVLLGLTGVLVGSSGPAEALRALAAGLLLLLGVVVVAFPWLYRGWQQLGEERRERIRVRERAEVAAHVHDSVLQTLTLIRRHAGDPDEVVRLARAEERALRAWLYAPAGDASRSLAPALQREAADVEAAYAVEVEVVAVGDAELDAPLGALVAAAREAMVNAAKHAGSAGPVRVFAEVDGEAAEVFVRDRGPGFVPGQVPPDRLGLRESVVGRMRRNGGTADVRTAPGEGTEVRLRMPRRAAAQAARPEAARPEATEEEAR